MMEQHDYLQINVHTVHSSLFFDVFRAGRALALRADARGGLCVPASGLPYRTGQSHSHQLLIQPVRADPGRTLHSRLSACHEGPVRGQCLLQRGTAQCAE